MSPKREAGGGCEGGAETGGGGAVEGEGAGGAEGDGEWLVEGSHDKEKQENGSYKRIQLVPQFGFLPNVPTAPRNKYIMKTVE